MENRQPLGDRSAAPGLAVLFLLFSLGACGVTHDQAGAVGGFASSASTLATGVKAVYIQGGDDAATLDNESFIIPRPGLAGRVRSGAFQKPDSFNGPLASSNLQGRLKAADALNAYGAALSSLIDTKTQNGDFSTAVGKLSGALKTIPSATLKDAEITTAQIDGLGSFLIAIGDVYLDLKRRQTLEAVVPASSPVIGRLCDMFGHDFDSGQVDSFAGVYVRAAGKNEADASGAIIRNAESTQDRAILMPIYRHARTLGDRADSLFAPLLKAATSCSKSNATLATAIADPKVSMADIQDFVQQADAAFTAVQATIGQK